MVFVFLLKFWVFLVWFFETGSPKVALVGLGLTGVKHLCLLSAGDKGMPLCQTIFFSMPMVVSLGSGPVVLNLWGVTIGKHISGDLRTTQKKF